jgi:hypothetical protein
MIQPLAMFSSIPTPSSSSSLPRRTHPHPAFFLGAKFRQNKILKKNGSIYYSVVIFQFLEKKNWGFPFNAKLVLKVEIPEDLAKFGYKVKMKIRK